MVLTLNAKLMLGHQQLYLVRPNKIMTMDLDPTLGKCSQSSQSKVDIKNYDARIFQFDDPYGRIPRF